MIVIDKVMISDDVVEAQFVCDLSKCKGGCCEEGDAGAPLTEEELDIVVDLFEKIRPYLTPQALAAIEKKGKYEYQVISPLEKTSWNDYEDVVSFKFIIVIIMCK